MPLATGAAPARAQEAPAAKRPAVARRVMVVDDNVDAASMLDMLLRSLGHETRVAHDGPEALRMAQEFRPEVVLLDIGMPGINGYELARSIRKAKGFEKLKLIALTGYGRPEDKALARAAGFDHHCVKPANIEELLPLLK
jgi:CheY-like chemotaxis protein